MTDREIELAERRVTRLRRRERVTRALDVASRLGWIVAIALWMLGFNAIQSSREETVRTSCIEQNERHDDTITALDKLLAEVNGRPGAPSPQELQQSRTATVLLIDALAPLRDCEQRVDELVGRPWLERWLP
jgi:hypothetical protein